VPTFKETLLNIQNTSKGAFNNQSRDCPNDGFYNRNHKKKKDGKNQADDNFTIFYEGYLILWNHPICGYLMDNVTNEHYRWEIDTNSEHHPLKGNAIITNSGRHFLNTFKKLSPPQWARILAHSVLHLVFCHIDNAHDDMGKWNAACDCYVEKFLTDLNFGDPFYPDELPIGIKSEEQVYQYLLMNPNAEAYYHFSTAGEGRRDFFLTTDEHDLEVLLRNPADWGELFAHALSIAVQDAVNAASGAKTSGYTKAFKTLQWFVSSYPLLGAVAADFRLIEDSQACQRMEISIAAVSPSMSELYINPAYSLTDDELKFVIGHELLHAALCHGTRIEWRDPYLWNVACDFVINVWLTEMEVGGRPRVVLYDEQFNSLSAEAVYDRIVMDLRTYRKLATLRGVGLGDVIVGRRDDKKTEVDLDAFYRRALSEGLSYHQDVGRGYLPASLVEEIYARSHPPISWDVKLANWFDERFTPIEKRRTYAKPSRRQSSTLDIPRPSYS
jgi:predicted metal-dependent peptidase